MLEQQLDGVAVVVSSFFVFGGPKSQDSCDLMFFFAKKHKLACIALNGNLIEINVF